MIDVSIPRCIAKACNQISDAEKAKLALGQFIKKTQVIKAISEHKKQLANSSTEEYMTVLKILLSDYQAGQSVNAGDLAARTLVTLNKHFKESTISRNNIRDSFIPMLKTIGLIQGKKPLIWTYLDTRSYNQKLQDNCLAFYYQYIQKTDAEKKLEQEQKRRDCLQKQAELVNANRALQDDIHHSLKYIRKENLKCEELAHELNIPYSQVKEEMKQRKNGSNNERIKYYAFGGLVAVILVAGFIGGSDNTQYVADTHLDPMAEDVQPIAPLIAGLTRQESEWRQQYIVLYKQHGVITQQAQNDLIALSGEYMIPLKRMQKIISMIKKEELNP